MPFFYDARKHGYTLSVSVFGLPPDSRLLYQLAFIILQTSSGYISAFLSSRVAGGLIMLGISSIILNIIPMPIILYRKIETFFLAQS